MKQKNKKNWMDRILKICERLSLPISLMMLLAGCSSNRTTNQTETTSKENTSIVETVDMEEPLDTFNIGDREYVITDENEISYTIVDGDNLWSICHNDLHLSVEEIMEYNNLSSDLIHPGNVLKIPISYFKDIDKKMGIKVSEENGDINWEVVAALTDFALITFADYSQDAYTYTDEEKELLNKFKEEAGLSPYFRIADDQALDENFDSNVTSCEENGIPYGVVVYGDINKSEYNENVQTGKKDAEEVISHLEGYNVTYPVILEISDSYRYKLNSNMREEEYKKEKELSEQYCIDFLNEIKANGYYPMLCVTDEVYAHSVSKNKDLLKFDTIIYKSWRRDDKYDIINQLYCNISKGEEIDMPGMAWMQSYCETYVDNTKEGMETLVANNLNGNDSFKIDKNILKKTILNLEGHLIAIFGAGEACVIVVIAIGVFAKKGINYIKRKKKDKRR